MSLEIGGLLRGLMSIEIRPEGVSTLFLSLGLCRDPHKISVFHPSKVRWMQPSRLLIIAHQPLLTRLSLTHSARSLFTRHRDPGIQFLGLSRDLNFTTLGGRPRPALNINLQNENNFNNPLTFDDIKIESSSFYCSMLVYNLEQIIYLKAKSFLLFIVRYKKSRLNENQAQTMESMLCSLRFFCCLPVIIVVHVTVCHKVTAPELKFPSMLF